MCKSQLLEVTSVGKWGGEVDDRWGWLDDITELSIHDLKSTGDGEDGKPVWWSWGLPVDRTWLSDRQEEKNKNQTPKSECQTFYSLFTKIAFYLRSQWTFVQRLFTLECVVTNLTCFAEHLGSTVYLPHLYNPRYIYNLIVNSSLFFFQK